MNLDVTTHEFKKWVSEQLLVHNSRKYLHDYINAATVDIIKASRSMPWTTKYVPKFIKLLNRTLQPHNIRPSGSPVYNNYDCRVLYYYNKIALCYSLPYADFTAHGNDLCITMKMNQDNLAETNVALKYFNHLYTNADVIVNLYATYVKQLKTLTNGHHDSVHNQIKHLIGVAGL